MRIARRIATVVGVVVLGTAGPVLSTGASQAAVPAPTSTATDAAAAACVASFGAGRPQLSGGRIYGLATATNCNPPAYSKVCAELWQTVIVSMFPPMTVRVHRDTECSALYSMSSVRIFASYPCSPSPSWYTKAIVYNRSGAISGIKTSGGASTGC